MDKLTTIKAAITAGVTALTGLWGRTGWLAALWIAAMLLDYATGTAATVKTGTWSSRTAREGLWHKTGSIVAVLVSALLDLAAHTLLAGTADYDVLLFPLVTAWYLLTELGSIVENAGKLGAPMPAFLKKAVAALRERVDSRGEDAP